MRMNRPTTRAAISAPRGTCIAAVAFFSLSCGSASATPDPGGDSGTPPTGTIGGGGLLPCDVDAVLAARCRECHGATPLYGASMPLVTNADLHVPSRSNASIPVYQAVRARTHDATRPMPPPPSARLDAASQATLDAWIDRGAPARDGASCAASPGMDGGDGSAGGDAGPPAPDDCVFDTHVAPAVPYVMHGGETYACYGFDIPTRGKRHVTQIKVRVDNARIVHHALLLASPTSTGATPIDCSPAPSFGAPMIYAWAPGGLPLVVPSEAGFPQTESTHYIVQIHYNNAAGAPNPSDRTGFDLCTTPNLRKYDADVVAFGTELIVIPPRAPGSVTSCYTVPAALDGRRFFGAFPHMHQLGKSITTRLLPGGSGAPVDMGTDTAWDFSSQPWVPIDAGARTGDVIKTSCAWHNPGGSVVTFGQNTENEMCYSFTAYYPKTDVSMGWAAPAIGSVPCQ
jgi:hypothetical protein